MLRSRRLLRSNPLTNDGSSSGSPPAAFGPFRVLHQVGAGTTGVVFRAHDPVEGRLVAIKAFRLDLTPERLAELARALEALPERGLSHPSIAAPIGAGLEDGIAWFAQAYVPAESLDSALRQYGPPPVSDVLTIVTQLAGALDFAAAAGVVHGSLHPRDVLVAPGETHLVDLGVAAALESCGVRAPVRRPYSPPERMGGRPISRAGDIFALGAIAFELLSGQPVTGAGDDVVVTLPDVPGSDREALLETFSFALALAPDERYATALAFAAPLKQALGDALTRPGAPRKRRTPRGPDALLPMDDHEPETVPALPPPGVPLVDRSSPPSRYEGTEDFALRSSDPGATHHDAPAYLSGPTEPEPSAPAIEPIAAPGEADPIGRRGYGARYASVEDDDDTVSSLDGVQSTSAEPVDPWDLAGHAAAARDSRAADGEMGRLEARRLGVDDALDYPLGDNPNYAPDRHAPYEPPAGDYAAGDYAAAPDADTSASRAPWLAFAALLLVGIVAGLAGGWFLFSGRGERPAGAADAAPSASGTTPSPDTPGSTAARRTESGAARPREWTDDAVRQSGGGPPPRSAAPAAAAAAPTSRPSAEPPAVAAPAARAAAPPVETAPRGRLVVRTRPAGARVEIAGRNRGESPATLTDLPFGRHTVRLSRSGYATEQLPVTLSARRPAVNVDVTLRRNAPAAPARSARAPAGGFVGTLVVESRPAGAKVFLDGRGVGVTPLTLRDVSVGSHVVRLDLIGYQRWSTSIRVVAGERERVAASLEEVAAR